MNTFTSILVDVDAMAAAHPALDRAIELARRCGARLKIVDVVDLPDEARSLLPAGAESMLVEPRRRNLSAFAGLAQGLDVETAVLFGPPAGALIRDVEQSGHDLVVRSHARDLAAPRAWRLGMVDMQLFRQCPCAVWAVGPGASSTPTRILAAVHANPDDRVEQLLNRRIIETALTFASVPGGELTIMQTWTAFGERLLRGRYTADELTSYVEAAHERARANLDALLAGCGAQLTQAAVSLEKGQPEVVIPQAVVAKGIDLVVMGTVARGGLAGLLMGNTAERLLQHIPCSVLALKPEGFPAHRTAPATATEEEDARIDALPATSA